MQTIFLENLSPNSSEIPGAVATDAHRYPESQLLIWCARTAVTDELKEHIRQKVQEPLDWAVVLDMAQAR
jgi:hypothetical protein